MSIEIPPDVVGPSDYIEPQSVVKMIQTLEMEEDLNKRFIAKLNSMLAISNNFVQLAAPLGVVGTAAAAGTPILTVAIAANRRLIVTKLKGTFIDTGGPAAAGLAIGTAAALPIAAPADIMPFPVGGGSLFELADGISPLLVFNGGAAGTNMIIYAPASFLGNAANNAITRTFQCSYAGLLI